MVTMLKHAFMIIAHNQFDILEKLIKLLDDERNDLYIHIDKKVKGFDFNKFNSLPKKSKIYFVPRIKVTWGGFSQIKCEMILLKEAVRLCGYAYYHLLSGVDLPIKTNNQIHEFFNKNYGTEFIHFAENSKCYYEQRVAKYHLLQEYIGLSRLKFINYFTKAAEKLILHGQKLININRLKHSQFQLKYGSNWFSITHDMAQYVLRNRKWIEKYFSYSQCADELFMQTLAYNSDFKKKLRPNVEDGSYLSNMRYIDWNRGKPYVWKVDDYNTLFGLTILICKEI